MKTLHPALQLVHDELASHAARFRTALGTLIAIRDRRVRHYFADHQGYRFHANVKLHRWADLSRALKAARIPKRLHSAAEEHFSDDYLQSLTRDAIEYARKTVVESITSPQFESSYWDEEEKRLRALIVPARGWIKKKLNEALAKHLAARQQKEMFVEAARLVDNNHVGFFGRQGGHFCFRTESGDMEDAAHQILNDYLLEELTPQLAKLLEQCSTPEILFQEAVQRWNTRSGWRATSTWVNCEDHPLAELLAVRAEPRSCAELIVILSIVVTEHSLKDAVDFFVGPLGFGSGVKDSICDFVGDAESAAAALAREEELGNWLVRHMETRAARFDLQAEVNYHVGLWRDEQARAA